VLRFPYDLGTLRGDLFGSLTSAVVALPVALAFGIASGMGAAAGLYSVIAVGFFAAVFGGTRSQISGPTGPMTIAMAVVITTHASTLAEALTVVVLGGLIQILLGVLRMGRFVVYTPYVVISGFMSGVGLIIMLIQALPFLGAPPAPGGPMGALRAIPDAVVAAVIIVTLCTLFVVGMREVVAGIRNNPRSGLIAGLAIWTGIAIEFDVVFPDFFTNFAGGLLNNGMTTGGILAILLVGLTIPRVARFRGRVDVRELPQINEFIRRFARRSGLEALIGRMEAAAEETLLMLVEPHGTEGGEGDDPDRSRRALLLTASHQRGHAVMRFKAATAGQEELNLQDRLAWLGDEAGSEQEEQAISLRLLRHLASSVRHQQYHNVDIVTLKVSAANRTV